jgi:hypothetical protein
VLPRRQQCSLKSVHIMLCVNWMLARVCVTDPLAPCVVRGKYQYPEIYFHDSNVTRIPYRIYQSHTPKSGLQIPPDLLGDSPFTRQVPSLDKSYRCWFYIFAIGQTWLFPRTDVGKPFLTSTILPKSVWEGDWFWRNILERFNVILGTTMLDVLIFNLKRWNRHVFQTVS